MTDCRSLTPFLRSQGRTDGHGLVFNSRISPSPVRTMRRRRKKMISPSPTLPTSGLDKADSGPDTSSVRFTPRNLSKEFSLMSSSDSELEDSFKQSTPRLHKSVKTESRKSRKILSKVTTEGTMEGVAEETTEGVVEGLVVKKHLKSTKQFTSITKILKSSQSTKDTSMFRTPPRNESLLSPSR